MSDVKAYRLLLRVKNNRLWRALQDTWPDETQARWAERMNVNAASLGAFLNIQVWPRCVACAVASGHRAPGPRTRPYRGGTRRRRPESHIGNPCVGWYQEALRVSAALGFDPAYLFAPDLYGIAPAPSQVLELDDPRSVVPMLEVASPEDTAALLERRQHVHDALKTLSPREERVLTLRFRDELTLAEVGDALALTAGRIQQIETRAIRKLRHPTRRRLLRDVAG